MSVEMGVLILHGMGSQENNFAEPLIRELQHKIKKKGYDPDKIAFRPVHWAPVLIGKEEDLWKNVKEGNDLDWIKIRKIVINSFGDAVAYNQRSRGEKDNPVYRKIHDIIHNELSDLRKEDFKNQDKPLILMGHSLGAHILSNYVWDRQHDYEPAEYGNTPLEKMKTLVGIITFGSIIPLFTLGLEKVESITFPHKKCDETIRKAAKWLNFYDNDDVLGYPLKNLSDNGNYNEAVTEDIEINAGSIFTSWNPFSHARYWTDNDFTKRVAGFLCDLLEVF